MRGTVARRNVDARWLNEQRLGTKEKVAVLDCDFFFMCHRVVCGVSACVVCVCVCVSANAHTFQNWQETRCHLFVSSSLACLSLFFSALSFLLGSIPQQNKEKVQASVHESRSKGFGLFVGLVLLLCLSLQCGSEKKGMFMRGMIPMLRTHPRHHRHRSDTGDCQTASLCSAQCDIRGETGASTGCLPCSHAHRESV